jgi:hypothetical protein
MNRPALLLSLLALAAVGLVACGGDHDDQSAAASGTETTRDELAADRTPVAPTPAKYGTKLVPKGTGKKAARAQRKAGITVKSPQIKATRAEQRQERKARNNKSCGRFGRYKFAVVEGDVSCRVARGVMRANSVDPPPPGGPGGPPRMPGSWSCDGPDAWWVCVNEAEETIVAWCCGTDQQEATYIAAGLRE